MPFDLCSTNSFLLSVFISFSFFSLTHTHTHVIVWFAGGAQGVLFERKLFHSTFGTADQKEGMGAFASKGKPVWKDQ